MKNNKNTNKNNGAKKTAGNNQWISDTVKYSNDNRERRDGPGGEKSDT